MSNSILKAVAGVVALGAIAFGASAIAGASSSGSGGGGSAAFGGPRGGGMPGRPPGAYGMPPGAGGAPGANGVPNGSPGANGTPPPGAHGGPPPGFGQPVTGATAAKVKAAALARYPGTIEHIFALPGGRGYVAHVFRSNGSEVHVLVSPRFRVIGVDEGPGGPPPAAGAAKPNGSST